MIRSIVGLAAALTLFAGCAGHGSEPMLAELLRTRLVEKGVAVDHACATRCMEVTLQELVIDKPAEALEGK